MLWHSDCYWAAVMHSTNAFSVAERSGATRSIAYRWRLAAQLLVTVRVGIGIAAIHAGCDGSSSEVAHCEGGGCDDVDPRADLLRRASKLNDSVCLDVTLLGDELLVRTLEIAATTPGDAPALIALGFAASEAPGGAIVACGLLSLDLDAVAVGGATETMYRSASAATAEIVGGLENMQDALDDVAGFDASVHAMVDGDKAMTGRITAIMERATSLATLASEIDAAGLFPSPPERVPGDPDKLGEEGLALVRTGLQLGAIHLDALSISLEHVAVPEANVAKLARIGRRAAQAHAAVKVLAFDLLDLQRDPSSQPSYRTAGAAARLIHDLTDDVLADIEDLKVDSAPLAGALEGFAAGLPGLTTRIDEISNAVDARQGF